MILSSLGIRIAPLMGSNPVTLPKRRASCPAFPHNFNLSAQEEFDRGKKNGLR